ncbi:MAG: hypothetical protein ABR998_05755 [Gemmatimonadales bacterium]
MRHVVVVLALAAAVAGCSDQGPVAGELSVRLTTSRTTDRAVLFKVVGKLHGVTAGTGASYRIISDTSATGDTAWVAVITPQGTGLAPGEIARITVPDTRVAGSYQISLTEVAASDYSVGTFSGITLTVVKP